MYVVETWLFSLGAALTWVLIELSDHLRVLEEDWLIGTRENKKTNIQTEDEVTDRDVRGFLY